MTDDYGNAVSGAVSAPTAYSLPVGLPKKVLGAVTQNVVLWLGLSVFAVILGSIALSWFDKTIPEGVIAMGGVALGFLGKAITDGGAQ